jgi:hypothetical protein
MEYNIGIANFVRMCEGQLYGVQPLRCYYVVPRENFKAWEIIFRRRLRFEKVSTRIYVLFVSTPYIQRER